MNYGFNIYERLVLEELATGKCSLDSLAINLGLNKKIISKTLKSFTHRGIVAEENDFFFINLENFRNHVAGFKESARYEIVELLEGLAKVNLKGKPSQIGVQSDKSLKMRKVFLDSSQAKILNTLFHSIDKFITDIESENISNKVKPPMMEKQLICWGHCNYLSAAKQIIKSV